MERFFRLSVSSGTEKDYSLYNIFHRSSQLFLYEIQGVSTSGDFLSYGVRYDNPGSR